MRKRFGRPLAVEPRCVASNGACGQRDKERCLVVASDGPRWCSPSSGASHTRIHPNHVARLRDMHDGQRVPRDGLLEDFGERLPVDDGSRAFYPCICPEHGRGSVRVTDLWERFERFRRTGVTQGAPFIPDERSGHIWVSDDLVEVDADWWNAQDEATRRSWFEKRDRP